MGVKLQRDGVDVLLDQRDQRARALRREQSGDVLEANAIGLDRRRLARPRSKVLVGVARRDRVNDVDDHFHAELLQRGDFHRRGVVIVPGIGRARQRDAVGDHALDHQQAHRAGNFLEPRRQPAVVTQPRAVKFLGALAHPGPGVFFMFFDVLDVAGKAEKLHGLETAAVHLLGDRQHGAGAHPQRPQAQRPIAHSRVDEVNFVHAVGLPVCAKFFKALRRHSRRYRRSVRYRTISRWARKEARLNRPTRAPHRANDPTRNG